MSKVSNRNLYLIVVAAIVFAVAVFYSVTRVGAVQDVEAKVNICHYTSSESNPIEAIRVNVSAFDGEGDNDHTLHGDFLYGGSVNEDNQQPLKPEGDEWCADNEPEVTPTPTEEITPTPTLTPTVTATPTATVTNNTSTTNNNNTVNNTTNETKSVEPAAAPATGRG